MPTMSLLSSTARTDATVDLPGLNSLDPSGTMSGMSGATSVRDHLLQPLLQFTDGWFILDLLLGYFFAILCAAVLTWGPGRVPGSRIERVVGSDGMLLLLGVIGVTVAELVEVMPAMALVIFGIGGLIRFRTTFGDSELTGKGIIIVIVGLACGLGEIAMACFVTAVSWIIITILESRVVCRVQLRFDTNQMPDERHLEEQLASHLAASKIRIRSIEPQPAKGRLLIYLTVPSRSTAQSVRDAVFPVVNEVISTVDLQVRFR